MSIVQISLIFSLLTLNTYSINPPPGPFYDSPGVKDLELGPNLVLPPEAHNLPERPPKYTLDPDDVEKMAKEKKFTEQQMKFLSEYGPGTDKAM